MIFYKDVIFRATAKNQHSKYLLTRRSRLIAISVVDHLLVAAARLAASLTSLPATALLSGRRFVVDAVLVQVSHVLPKALYRSLPQGILRAFLGRALVAPGREGSRSRSWRSSSSSSPAPPPPSWASPPPPPSSPRCSPPPSDCSPCTTTSPSPRYSSTPASSTTRTSSSPWSALFQGCYAACQHVRIHTQAIITAVSLQDTIVQATFQSSIYLQKSNKVFV